MFKIIAVVLAMVAVVYGQLEPVNYPPQPYSFGYETTDDFGTKLMRKESGDGAGAVTGSYGYADKAGMFRTVEYVADKLGFRAQVKTNEPGTERSEPASVLMDSNPIVIPYTAPAKVLSAPVYIASSNRPTYSFGSSSR